MILRLVLVAVAIAAVWSAVAMWERRPVRRVSGLGFGLTLVTADGCRLCGPALTALSMAGVTPTVIDAGQLPESAGPVHSVPTAVVTDHDGRVVIRRAGRSVITDARMIADAARRTIGGDARRAPRSHTR